MKISPIAWPAWLLMDKDEALAEHLPALSETEWQSVTEQAIRHQLAAMLYWRLCSIGG